MQNEPAEAPETCYSRCIKKQRVLVTQSFTINE